MGLSNYRVRRCLPDRVSARTADGQGRVASAVLLLLLCVPHALTAQVDPAADYQTLRATYEISEAVHEAEEKRPVRHEESEHP